jgi:hypothetical protein
MDCYFCCHLDCLSWVLLGLADASILSPHRLIPYLGWFSFHWLAVTVRVTQHQVFWTKEDYVGCFERHHVASLVRRRRIFGFCYTSDPVGSERLGQRRHYDFMSLRPCFDWHSVSVGTLLPRLAEIMKIYELWPNKSPEPTAVGAVSSAIAVHAASRRWLSFFR